MCNEIYNLAKCKVRIFNLFLNAETVRLIVIYQLKTEAYDRCKMNTKLAHFAVALSCD